MSDLSPLSGVKQKSNFGAVRSVEDPAWTRNGHWIETPVQYFGVFPRPIPR
jgi:hypothetical protein